MASLVDQDPHRFSISTSGRSPRAGAQARAHLVQGGRRGVRATAQDLDARTAALTEGGEDVLRIRGGVHEDLCRSQQQAVREGGQGMHSEVSPLAGVRRNAPRPGAKARDPSSAPASEERAGLLSVRRKARHAVSGRVGALVRVQEGGASPRRLARAPALLLLAPRHAWCAAESDPRTRGHSTLAMTLRYMHLAPSQLQEAIALLNFGQ